MTKKKTTERFPLSWHPRGGYCKRIRGHVYYFGKDKDTALARWLAEKDNLLAGRGRREVAPTAPGEPIPIGDAINHYLDACNAKVESGERTRQWFVDQRAAMRLVVKCLGARLLVSHLAPPDFARLRDYLGRRTASGEPVSASTMQARIRRVRAAFSWMRRAEILLAPPRYGASFDHVAATRVENERLGRGPATLAANELRRVLVAAKPTPDLYAAVLLAANTGAQNTDIERLRWRDLDLSGGWYLQPRDKKAKPRRGKLWARTVDALCALGPGAPDELVFTRPAREHLTAKRLGREFSGLLAEAGIVRRRCGFRTLRHTFITQASQTADLLAVQMVVGHADRSITSTYIHEIYDSRLEAVAETVERWLFD